MSGCLLRMLFILSIAVGLSACASGPKPMPQVQDIYDIRDVAVTANSGIPRRLITGIAVRMKTSIDSTFRPAPLPRAVMNINVVGMNSSPSIDGNRSETEVSVTLTDVPSGQAMMVRNFLVYSFAIKSRDASESAAEAIAARLRVEYSLAQPLIRKPRPSSPDISTRMTDDTLVPITRSRTGPVIVPLETVPVVGADQDPILNSKTNVDGTLPAQKAAIPASKAVEQASQPAANAIEEGAKVKVVIGSKAGQPAADEPCVETMDKKC